MAKRNSVATMTATVEIDKRESFEQLVDCIKDMQKTADKDVVYYSLEGKPDDLKKSLKAIEASGLKIGVDLYIKSNSKSLQKEIDNIFGNKLDVSNLITLDNDSLKRVLKNLYEQVGDADTNEGKEAGKRFVTAYNVAIKKGIKFTGDNNPFIELNKWLKDEKVVTTDFIQTINKQINEIYSKDVSNRIKSQIEETTAAIKKEEESLKHVNDLINGNISVKGKNNLWVLLQKANNKLLENEKSGKRSSDVDIVNYMNYYKAAEEAGVAQSRLNNAFNAEAFGRYNNSLNEIKNSYSILEQSIISLKQKLDELNNDLVKSNTGDAAILNWIEDLEKAETSSIETSEAIKKTIDISKNADAGGLEVWENALNEISQAAKKTREEVKKTKDTLSWIRGETGGANTGYDSYTQAVNKFTNQKIHNYIDEDGNSQQRVSSYVNMDKLAKAIIADDTKILKLEHQIKHTQGDTSGLEENLGIIKQERATYEAFLDEVIKDPYYETTESQRQILIQQRAINEEMIRNEQYTKDSIVAEKEALRLKNEQQRLMQQQYSILQKQSSERINNTERDQQQKVALLLDEQEKSYKKIWDIRSQIAKLDPNKNKNEISELERQKDNQLKIYNSITQSIKKIDEEANAEAQVNNLLKIRIDGLNKIAQIQSKLSDSAREAEQKSSDSALKATQKAIQSSYNTLRKESASKQQSQEKQRQAEINTLVNQQTSAYKEYLNIRTKIAKLDPNKNKNEIEILEVQKQEALNVYAARTKELKVLDEIKNSEQQVTVLLKMRQDAAKEINLIESKRQDSLKQDLANKEKELKTLADSGKYVKSLKNDLEELANEINQINKKPIIITNQDEIDNLQKLIKRYDDLKQKTKAADFKLAQEDSIAKINLQIEEYIQKNTKMGNKFRQQFENLKIDFTNETDLQRLKEIVKQFNILKTEVEKANKTGKSPLDTLIGRIKQMSTNFIAMYFSLYDIIRYVRTSVDTIRELDNSLVDLKKTTTMTNDELNDFYNNSSSIAKQLGATTQKIIQQAANWSRLGYSSKNAATEMAALSSQFAAISPGMDLDTATDDLVSTMQAFHIEVDDTERDIMDNVNRIGKYMPKRMVTYGVVYAA